MHGFDNFNVMKRKIYLVQTRYYKDEDNTFSTLLCAHQEMSLERIFNHNRMAMTLRNQRKKFGSSTINKHFQEYAGHILGGSE